MAKPADSAQAQIWPALPYEAWKDTCTTLHLWTQIVGKIRLAKTPVDQPFLARYPLRDATRSDHLADSRPRRARSRSISTSSTIELLIQTSDGAARRLALEPQSVADFYGALMAALGELDIRVRITQPRTRCRTRFRSARTTPRLLRSEYAQRFWCVLLQVDRVFKQFRTRFRGKVSPVHFFWVASTCGDALFRTPGADTPGRHSPSAGCGHPRSLFDEVSSAGFWPGGGAIDYPAFYCLRLSDACGLRRDAPSGRRPRSSTSELGEFILPYDAVRHAEAPDAMLLGVPADHLRGRGQHRKLGSRRARIQSRGPASDALTLILADDLLGYRPGVAAQRHDVVLLRTRVSSIPASRGPIERLTRKKAYAESGVRYHRTMRWRFDDIVTFLHVVEAGGITAAAERLNVSKSVISKRISDLESTVGAELFRRSTRRIVPNDRGIDLYERMRALVHEFDEAMEQVSTRAGELRGRLRMTAPMTFGTRYLGPVLAAFARNHPNLELALDLDDRVIDLVGNGYDMAIRIGRLQDSSLIARKLCLSRRIVCCSPAYAQARGLPTSIEDLSAHECIDYANVHSRRLWQFEPQAPGGKPRSVLTHSRIVANNGEAMRDMAIAGTGSRDPAAFHRRGILARRHAHQGLAGRDPAARHDLRRLSLHATRPAQGARADQPSRRGLHRRAALGAGRRGRPCPDGRLLGDRAAAFEHADRSPPQNARFDKRRLTESGGEA